MKKWIAEHNIEQLKWPSQSPDLNSIENLRHYLKIQIHFRTLQNIQELKTYAKKNETKLEFIN